MRIVEALDFADRVEAVEFVFSCARPDMPSETRRREAIIHGLPAGDWHALVPHDLYPEMEPKPRIGYAESPIITARQNGELVGAAVCSCLVEDLPLRVMAGAVRADWRGRGVYRKIISRALELAPVVGVAARVDHTDRQARGAHLGFAHWYKSALDYGLVGFSRPIDPAVGLLYAAPIATDEEIMAGEARLASIRKSKPVAGPTVERIA